MSATSNVQEAKIVVNLGALLDAGDGALVTLVAGETQLAAHRAVLTARSPVFKAMFMHNTLEASSGVVSIPDVEGPVLRLLLSYLYTLQVPQPCTMAPQLLVAADKYGLPDLKAACEQQVAVQLTVENATAAAVLSLRHSCPSLTAAAVDFIRANPQVMATQGWEDAVLEHPRDVVQVSRLLADPPIKTRSPAGAGGSDHGQTAAATVPHDTPPPDAASVSFFENLSGEKRVSWLFQAAKEGAVGELQALLAVGVDVGAMDKSGKTALHWAAEEGQVEAARCLIGGGAFVGARDSMQRTPLHCAANGGHAAVVQLLLAASAHPVPRSTDGYTPLHYAAIGGNAAVVRLLLAASVHPSPRSGSGWTPLHVAVWHKRADAAAALLEGGADREARDNEGRTALDLARKEHNQRFIDILTQPKSVTK